MQLEEFREKVQKLIRKKKRGFKIEVELYVDNLGVYTGMLKVDNWRYQGLWGYGIRNYDFEFQRFKWRSDIMSTIIKEKSLEELINAIYDEIKYIIKVYDTMIKKEFYQKIEFEF